MWVLSLSPLTILISSVNYYWGSFLKCIHWSILCWILKGNSLIIQHFIYMRWFPLVLVSLWGSATFSLLILSFICSNQGYTRLPVGVLRPGNSLKVGKTKGLPHFFPIFQESLSFVVSYQCLENYSFLYLFSFFIVSNRSINLVPVAPSWIQVKSMYILHNLYLDFFFL
jgi:hypothetical protein